MEEFSKWDGDSEMTLVEVQFKSRDSMYWIFLNYLDEEFTLQLPLNSGKIELSAKLVDNPPDAPTKKRPAAKITDNKAAWVTVYDSTCFSKCKAIFR